MQKPSCLSLMAAFTLVVAAHSWAIAAPYPREDMAVVLLPISTRPVSGAFDTVWWAELRVHNKGTESVPFHQGAEFCGIPFCENAVPAGKTLRLTMGARPSGLQGQLAYVNRDDAALLSFSYQTWVSNEGREWPVSEVPVVGEGELFRDGGVLPHVPVGPTSRINLRLYDAEPNTGNFVRLRIYPAVDGPEAPALPPIVDEVHMFNYRGVGVGDAFDFPELPGYIQLDDLGSRYPSIAAHEAIRIELEPITGEHGLALWFFATVTDNAKQSVVNYTPNLPR
jgi:hypothetical protein